MARGRHHGTTRGREYGRSRCREQGRHADGHTVSIAVGMTAGMTVGTTVGMAAAMDGASLREIGHISYGTTLGVVSCAIDGIGIRAAIRRRQRAFRPGCNDVARRGRVCFRPSIGYPVARNSVQAAAGVRALGAMSHDAEREKAHAVRGPRRAEARSQRPEAGGRKS